MTASKFSPQALDPSQEPDQNQELPPSYIDSTTTPQNLDLPTQLRYLTTRIITTRTLQSLHATQTDSSATTLISSQLPNFFSAFAATGLQQGTMYVVPATAVSPEATLAGQDLFVGQFLDVRRVEGLREKEKSESRDEGANMGLDTGTDAQIMAWWKDRDMAKRVAGYLEPEKPVQEKELSPAAVEEKELKGKGKSWWRRNPKMTENEPVRAVRVESKKEVVMRVAAEEVSFRRTNPFGLYETETGYAIVVKLSME